MLVMVGLLQLNYFKFAGDDGPSCAPLLTAAAFHEEGTLPSMMTRLKRSRRAGCTDGQHIVDIRSKGEGEDEDLVFLIT